MDATIRKYCMSCFICIKNKTHRIREIDELSHLGPITTSFEIMSLDSIDGFGGNHSSKRYLHLLVNHCTRYAYILTSKHQQTPNFIKLLAPVFKENSV